MKLSIYSYTNQGGREHNEDSLRWTSDGTEGVFVLADGLGGHDRGEVASQLAVEVICGGEDSPVPGREELLERFQQANARILEQQKQPGQEEMKTTAVALSLSGGTAAWAHIGDSRLYRCSQGRLDQLTRDHSVTYMKYLGARSPIWTSTTTTTAPACSGPWETLSAPRRGERARPGRGTPSCCAPTAFGSSCTTRRCWWTV